MGGDGGGYRRRGDMGKIKLGQVGGGRGVWRKVETRDRPGRPMGEGEAGDIQQPNTHALDIIRATRMEIPPHQAGMGFIEFGYGVRKFISGRQFVRGKATRRRAEFRWMFGFRPGLEHSRWLRRTRG